VVEQALAGGEGVAWRLGKHQERIKAGWQMSSSKTKTAVGVFYKIDEKLIEKVNQWLLTNYRRGENEGEREGDN
jgi:hypothetical protein